MQNQYFIQILFDHVSLSRNVAGDTVTSAMDHHHKMWYKMTYCGFLFQLVIVKDLKKKKDLRILTICFLFLEGKHKGLLLLLLLLNLTPMFHPF